MAPIQIVTSPDTTSCSNAWPCVKHFIFNPQHWLVSDTLTKDFEKLPEDSEKSNRRKIREETKTSKNDSYCGEEWFCFPILFPSSFYPSPLSPFAHPRLWLLSLMILFMSVFCVFEIFIFSPRWLWTHYSPKFWDDLSNLRPEQWLSE